MHTRERLIHPEVYKLLISEEYNFPAELALIMTNNNAALQKIGKKDLEEANELTRKKTGRSLFDQALRCGNLNAIKILVDSNITIANDDASLKKYLHELFCETNQVNFEDESSIEDKSTDNLINILAYLKNNIAINHALWPDKPMIEHILAECIHQGYFTSVQVFLKQNMLENVNVPDQDGFTALYYLMLQKEKGILSTEGDLFIQELEKRGAKLTSQENEKLEYEKYYILLTEKLKSHDIKAVQELLNSHYAEQLDFEKLRIKYLGLSDEMLYMIASTVHTKSDYTNTLDKIILSSSHRIGVSGEVSSDTTKQLEGDNTPNSRIKLLESISGYASKNESFKKFQDAISFVYNIDKIAPNLESAINLMFQYYSEGHNMIMATDWKGHSIGISAKYDNQSNKTYVTISNRGEKGLNACLTQQAKLHYQKNENQPKTGSVIYELDGPLDRSFFSRMNSYEGKSSDFANSTAFNLELEKHLKNARSIAFLPAQPQFQGTCTYVNQKRSGIEGLLVIEAICQGKPLNKVTLDNAYDQYKLFSVYDKKQAVDDLINYYQLCIANPNMKAADIGMLNQFIIKIILGHHSGKYNEIELDSSKALFKILPADMKELLLPIIPELSANLANKDRLTLYSAQRNEIRDIKILGSIDHLNKHLELVNNLVLYLKQNNISGNKIKAIEVGSDQLTIKTIIDKNVKNNLQDEVFKNGLKADVMSKEKKSFVFSVKNLDSLSCSLNDAMNRDGLAGTV